MIPRKILISHSQYTLRRIPQKELLDDEGNELLGRAYFNGQLIVVAKGLQPDLEREVVMHEIIHTIDYHAGDTFTEAQIQTLGYNVLNVLKANPNLRRYLFEE